MVDEDSPLVSLFAAPSHQLQAGNQEERFSNEGYGSGAKVTVCLTDVRMYLVDPRG